MQTAADPMELASALHVVGRIEDAEAAYRRILADAPDHRAARRNLIDLLNSEDRWGSAEALLREGAILFPADQELKFRLARSLLAGGDYAQGWPLYEARRGAVGVAPPVLSIPEWTGEAVNRLILWPEQGFGDMIQFARFLPELERRGVIATLLCPPELARLFAEAGLNIVSMEDGAKIADQQAWALIGSLPWRLGATLETLPPPVSIRVAARDPIGGVGFVGRGRSTHKNDANRSLPPQIVDAMLKLPGLVSLEPSDTYASDFQDTAEIVAALDHVITVDTAVAHLAASMGKPVSLLLSRLNADWRWMRDRSDSPWYPSIKIYRQAVAGRWRAVLDEALGDLGDLALRRAPHRPKPEIAIAPARSTSPAEAVPLAPAAPAAETGRSDPPRLESERRKAVIAAGETDRSRWEDPSQLQPSWDQRARLAVAYVPRGARVLDLGCGAMALERVLPDGCRYIPCDLVARDGRTLVCDFNAGEFPGETPCDVVTVLGVLEYIHDAPGFLRRLSALGRPVVLSYNIAGGRGPADRGSLGWVNDFSQAQLLDLLRDGGFTRVIGDEITPGQLLMGLQPCAPPKPERSVWILSHNNDGNFGDRLGVQVLSGLLPPNATVRHIHHKPWDAPPEGTPDLLIVCAGASLFGPLLTPELLQLAERADRAIGVFGTQYRQNLDAPVLGGLLDRLDMWWARYEEDALLYGAGRNNVRHLGDLMVDAFPLTRWTVDGTLEVGPEVLGNAPLDRLIERIQAHRHVKSGRLHPLLCALTSAETVAYDEQYEDDGVVSSGKFRSLLMDVFGMEKPEGRFWPVDRAAVGAYKAKVRGGLDALRGELARMLA
jgi:hypothetical protein